MCSILHSLKGSVLTSEGWKVCFFAVEHLLIIVCFFFIVFTVLFPPIILTVYEYMGSFYVNNINRKKDDFPPHPQESISECGRCSLSPFCQFEVRKTLLKVSL